MSLTGARVGDSGGQRSELEGSGSVSYVWITVALGFSHIIYPELAESAARPHSHSTMLVDEGTVYTIHSGSLDTDRNILGSSFPSCLFTISVASCFYPHSLGESMSS